MTDSTFAHFQLLRRTGERAMSEIFLARDTELDREVVLAVLPERLAGEPAAVDRFVGAARAAAGLLHQNLATVYNVGEHRGRPFIAMERVDGRPLAEFLAGGPLTVEAATSVALQVARGLAAAHRLGVCFGGLEIGDVLVGTSGRVRLLTFGLVDRDGAAWDAGGTEIAAAAPDQPTWRVQLDAGAVAADMASVGALLETMLGGPGWARSASAAAHPWTPRLRGLIARTRGDGEPLATIDTVARTLDQLIGPPAAASVDERHASPPPRRRWRPWHLVAALSLAAALATILTLGPRREGTVAGDRRGMIVVLPFRNLGEPGEQDFADGVTAEITARLSSLEGLGVISRTSAARYAGTGKSVRAIATELGVDHVVEGTIRWDRESTPHRVRITPRLVRAADDTSIWSTTYERELTEIFAVQSDLARRVVEALGGELRETERVRLDARPTDSIEAYQAYLRGVALLGSADFSRETIARTIQMFERAIALDPDFALAYARLSSAHSRSIHYGFDRSEGRSQRARDLAERALELDPDLSEAHLALGLFHYSVRRDHARALLALQEARRRGGDQAEVLQAMGYVRRRQGDMAGAAAVLEASLELDPLNAATHVALGETRGTLRRYEQSIGDLERAISLAPDQAYPYTELALVHLRRGGDTARARAVLADIPVSVGTEPCRVGYLVELLDRRYATALARLEDCEQAVLEAGVFYRPVALLRAMVHRLQGDAAAARAAFTAARDHLAARIDDDPGDHRLHAALGLALAGLGDRVAALRHGEEAVALYPADRDALESPTLRIDLALVQTMVGDHDGALRQLDRLLCMPSLMSWAWLEADPRWDPLREHPGYQDLLSRYPRGDGG
jgi:TolB-like protein/Flp pilus assembly protein TadD